MVIFDLLISGPPHDEASFCFLSLIVDISCFFFLRLFSRYCCARGPEMSVGSELCITTAGLSDSRLWEQAAFSCCKVKIAESCFESGGLFIQVSL